MTRIAKTGSDLVFAILLLASVSAWADHRKPAPNLAETRAGAVTDSQRQNLLAEMWHRRILSSESRSWTAEDLDTLLKLRAAENMGAVDLLRRKLGASMGGVVAPYRAAGSKTVGLRLTKAGFERWRFLRSQDAIELFDRKGVGTGLAFKLEDLEGRKLFDSDGLLTAAGDSVYNRALGNQPSWWKSPHSGEIFGTRAPPKAKPPEDPLTLAVPIGPEHPSITDQLWRAAWGRGYSPELRRSEMGKLAIVMQHDPTGYTGTGDFIVIVGKASDKKAARAEFDKRLPALPDPEGDKLVTVEEKLAATEKALEELFKKGDGKARLQIDRAGMERQLRELLKGKLAVVWVLAGPAPAEPEPAPEPAPAPTSAAPGGPIATPAPTGTATPPTPAPPPPPPTK